MRWRAALRLAEAEARPQISQLDSPSAANNHVSVPTRVSDARGRRPGTTAPSARREHVPARGTSIRQLRAQLGSTLETTHFVKKELDILGARNATIDDFRAVIAMLRRREFPVNATVTRSVSLENAGRALEDWYRDTRTITRIHVDFD